MKRLSFDRHSDSLPRVPGSSVQTSVPARFSLGPPDQTQFQQDSRIRFFVPGRCTFLHNRLCLMCVVCSHFRTSNQITVKKEHHPISQSNFPDEKVHKRLHSLIFLRHFLNDSDRIVLKLTGFVPWTCDPNSRAASGGRGGPF